MIARARVGDAEAHGNFVEEPDFGEVRGLGGKVIADEENDLVLAGLHFIGGEQRRFGAAIGIGLGGRDQRAVITVERPQFDFQAARGTAVRGVEDVRAKFGGHKSVRDQISQPKFRDFENFFKRCFDFLLARIV